MAPVGPTISLPDNLTCPDNSPIPALVLPPLSHFRPLIPYPPRTLSLPSSQALPKDTECECWARASAFVCTAAR